MIKTINDVGAAILNDFKAFYILLMTLIMLFMPITIKMIWKWKT